MPVVAFLPVSVRVKFVDPVSTAALGLLVSRTMNFWWKIFLFRSLMTSTFALSSAPWMMRFSSVGAQ